MHKGQITFPDPEKADDEGLLCYGGNLHPETLISAYCQGIFPWYDASNPILWWSPPLRMIMKPSELKVSKSLQHIINKNMFEIQFDHNFEEVIRLCSKVKRKGQRGTWITKEMKEAYINLHHLGYAHSVEAYQGETLVGGLYGVSLGKAFFGESMFHLISNASKVAFYHLVQRLTEWDFQLIDAQQNTKHLSSLGAYEIERKNFLILLQNALKFETKCGKWIGESD